MIDMETNLPSPVTDIETLIRENHRVIGFPNLSDRILEQPELIPELVSMSTSGREYPFPEYASWLLLHVARKKSDLVQKYHTQIIDHILFTTNTSVLRNLLGVSILLPLTDYQQGRFLDRLLSIVADNSSKPGPVAYAIQKLSQFIEMYPELRQEIKAIIELKEQGNLSPGMVVSIRRILGIDKTGRRSR